MANYRTQSELDFEKEIVHQLTIGSNQWTERKDLYEATPDKLWENFREKLNRNNIAALKHKELTDEEFNRVKARISNVKSPYDAAKILDAENGIGKIEIPRDDASQGTVTLNIFWKADVGGGNSSYEVVRQAIRPRSNDDDSDRRFDVTLLINGLPLIQIELKKSTVEINQAFNQIKKYAGENKYTDIYSLLQMFVIMSPDSSAYFANSRPDEFNKSFVFKWRDKDNNPVENGMDFAKSALNIPMAHKLVSEYKAIDEERKKLLLLRPYQIYAIEAILKRIKEHENGYVWHTTGSGKTLTSYKTAKLAAQLPSVDRVVFLVDRKALDDQTVGNFRAYASNDDMTINKTDNTAKLRKALLKGGNNIIISSIQKMANLVNAEQQAQEEGRNTRVAQSNLLDKRICFFVDEAHRSQFGKMRQDISNAFKNANWYGYTGTPIFHENRKKFQGDRGVTTQELFGEECHRYTLVNALEDHAVLPFNVEHVNTITNVNEIVEEIMQKQTAKELKKKGQELTISEENDIKKELNEMSDSEKESYLPNDIYENDEHLDRVVDYILTTGPKKMSLGKGNYNGILATSSIPMAIRYYKKLKEQKKLHPNEVDKDWPRVAITYSLAENDDDHKENMEGMDEAIADYNAMFDTNFHNNNEEISLYNEDVAKRTARRESYYAHLKRNQEINLVIVVNRLLTGFDAPKLNTLFVDKNQLEYANLIQAYSRTNRLENNDLKREGQIVTFRKPALSEEHEKEAYRLYGGEGSYEELMRPKYMDAVAKFKSEVAHLKRIAPNADDADDLKGKESKADFVKTFRRVNTQLNSLTMYNDFTWDNAEEEFGISEDEVQHYIGKFQRIKSEIQENQDDDEDDELSNLDFSLSIGSTVLVDYDYITGLLKELVDMRNSYDSEEEYQENMTDYLQKEAEIQEQINKYEKSGHEKQAVLLREILSYLDNHMVDPDKFDDFVGQYKNNKLNGLVNDFADKWGLDAEELKRVAIERHRKVEEGSHLQNLIDHGDLDHAAEQQVDDSLKIPIIYNAKANKSINAFIDKEIDAYL
ncbi:type I restriction endonuclease subunit R [Apilactobacillus kunkeei]|uniref:type I restriction endonuclease subunit R n=1 Tax=Apilactobacillus kunkeei TaxID=148814 RepID=UPI0030E85DF0